MPERTAAITPTRLCFAAAHVVLHEGYRDLGHRLDQPSSSAAIRAHLDWDATMRLRSWLSSHGFGIAEAMDTAQRFVLGWESAQELIARTGALHLPHGFCAGAGTDHLGSVNSPQDLIDGVAHQCAQIAEHDGIPVILPMSFLARTNASANDYVAVYRGILERTAGPLFLHWLGPMFLPELDGYFPGDSLPRILALDRQKVRGIKISMLDAKLEVRLRRELLPHDQIVLTGDDFHFSRLILGGDPEREPLPVAARVERYTTIGAHRVALGDFSHALLGVLDAIAEPAGRALQALSRGDSARFADLMGPCEQLSRHVFCAPTQHYKAGLAFFNYLAGRQPNPMLIRREDLARDADHYRRAAELAVRCGALADTPEVTARLQNFLAEPRA